MNRYRGKAHRMFPACRASLMAATLMLGLSACDGGPGSPRPPQDPPRPVTYGGYVTTTHFDLPARPIPPRPGPM